MKIFICPNCGSPIFFENSKCLNCHTNLGFSIGYLNFVQIDDINFRFCANHQLEVCNWVVLPNSILQYCEACALNNIVPDPGDKNNFEKWHELELAKHRLVYQLLILRLPLVPKSRDKIQGLSFDFLASKNSQNRKTGHSNGLVTILLEEGDSVYREQLRRELSEPYRTLLGHFRHEVGHYFWMLLANDHDRNGFLSVFGDENADYTGALKSYYQTGAPGNWHLNFISKYASAHPWEDWAETWAHYMHIMDTLETAFYLGLSLNSPNGRSFMDLGKVSNPYQIEDFRTIFEESIALTCAGNSLNRSMGLPDIYPFVISNRIFSKLEFIHKFVKSHQIQLN